MTIVLIAALLGPPLTAAAAPRSDLSDAKPFDLIHGVNRVRNFDDFGKSAQIVYAWRENMNAHGYGIYSVLMQRPDDPKDWNLVIFETHAGNRKGGSELDALYDEPFDGEQVIASVRFAKGRWRGRLATLAITARRDLSSAESFADPSPVKFDIYHLVENKGGVPGWPYYYFDRVAHFTSDKPYCNSDLALAKELELPLPTDYQGNNEDDGCVH